jgi:hypothetical protein
LAELGLHEIDSWPELNSAKPARHDDQDILHIQDVQQVEHPASCMGFAIVVTVLGPIL